MEPCGTPAAGLHGSDTDPFHVTWKGRPVGWDANRIVYQSLKENYLTLQSLKVSHSPVVQRNYVVLDATGFYQ